MRKNCCQRKFRVLDPSNLPRLSGYGERAHEGLREYWNICQGMWSLPAESRPCENMGNVPNAQGILVGGLEVSSAIRHIYRISPSSGIIMFGTSGVWKISKIKWKGTNPTRTPEIGERLEFAAKHKCSATAANSGREMGKEENPTWLGMFPPCVVQYLNNQCHKWGCAIPGWFLSSSGVLGTAHKLFFPTWCQLLLLPSSTWCGGEKNPLA